MRAWWRERALSSSRKFPSRPISTDLVGRRERTRPFSVPSSTTISACGPSKRPPLRALPRPESMRQDGPGSNSPRRLRLVHVDRPLAPRGVEGGPVPEVGEELLEHLVVPGLLAVAALARGGEVLAGLA